MPCRSRVTVTAAESPATVNAPDTCGSCAAGAVGARSLVRHAVAKMITTALRSRLSAVLARATLRLMIKVGLLAEFDHEIATTRRMIERIPEDRLSWRPHPKSMTLGGLAQHIATLPGWGLNILD